MPTSKEIFEWVLFITDTIGWGKQNRFKFYNNGFVFWMPMIYIHFDDVLVFQRPPDREAEVYIEGEWINLLREWYGSVLEGYYTARYYID